MFGVKGRTGNGNGVADGKSPGSQRRKATRLQPPLEYQSFNDLNPLNYIFEANSVRDVPIEVASSDL